MIESFRGTPPRTREGVYVAGNRFMKHVMRCISTLLPLLLLSCALVPTTREEAAFPSETREETLARIRALSKSRDYRELRRIGREYIERYDTEEGATEVRLLTGEASFALGFYNEAQDLLAPLAGAPGTGASKGEALILLSRIHSAKGRYGEAAERLLGALSCEIGGRLHAGTRELLAETVGFLSFDEIERLRGVYGGSPGIDLLIEGALPFVRAAGDTTTERLLLSDLAEARELEREFVGRITDAVVVPAPFEGAVSDSVGLRIGLLCPMSGRFSPLGQAFLRGAAMALKESRRGGLDGVEIVVGDTRADALDARAVAERLIGTERVVAMIGGVLSSTTIAAAQVAQYRRVVLVSPVATEDGIDDIGEWIFQTNPNIEVEIIALARLACGTLGHRRIAYLAADNHRARRIERLFRAEIVRSGGILLHAEYYQEGSTDFHANIEMLRRADPEAMFIASDAEDLVLVPPQLSFYEFGVQLLGTSAWNSRSLLLTAGRDMEGAIFPVIDYERRDEELYMTAAALLDEPVMDVNTFVLGGYRGTKQLLEALSRSGGGGESLRTELERGLTDIEHPYLSMIQGDGIPFFTVRDGRFVEYTTLEARR